ncbi:hypothetical protein F1559_002074 [Cyanidiococcus yangmingshanensis]|uniref:Uncharacterized protein n=1 Tax=Cyanidiococcus yangmingshanensis TaxID=2690220 RepID=A0A7J7IC86_9RHOD|nr:hypothetical protein F1559_002074 [Cyanidiococcus yangmingshanensis]
MSLQRMFCVRQLALRGLNARLVTGGRNKQMWMSPAEQRCWFAGGGSDEARIAAGGLGRRWQERETSQENMYFSKEDELVLKRLAAKMARQIAPTAEQLAQEREAIQGILQRHGVKVTPDLVEDLVKMRHGT